MALNEIDNLPLEWVRAFEAAGRTGSFTAAAMETGLTQAAISQRIRNLENRIGVNLFSRQARGVSLTIDGEAWLPNVSRALQALNRSAEELFGKPLAKVVISASASVTQLWIVPRLRALSDKVQYQVSLTTMNIEPDFAKANALLEIRYGQGAWSGMHAACLFQDNLAPIAAPALLQAGKPWQDLPRIAVSGPRPGWQEWAERTGEVTTPVPRYRFDSFVSALAAARAGLGVVLGSLPLCSGDLESGALARVTEKTLRLEAGYWMTAREGRLRRKQWHDLETCLCE